MKKIICVTCVALAAVISTVHAAYLGASISRQTPLTIEVNHTAPSTVMVLIAVRGRLDVDAIIVFDPSNPNLPAAVSYTIPPRVDRIIFEADASVNGSATLKLTQGANRFEIPITDHGRAVFDVID